MQRLVLVTARSFQASRFRPAVGSIVLLPNICSIGRVASGLSDLPFRKHSFNGGQYRAALHQYTAIYNADVATYRQTVLTAFQQVEDYLAAVRIYSQQIERQQEALKSAQQYLDLQTGRYETGLDPYVNVVTAQTTVLSDQEALATLQVEQMTFCGATRQGAWRRVGRFAVAYTETGNAETYEHRL